MFSRFRCFNDHRERVSFQGSTANQRAVDVRLSEQFCRVSCVYGTAVLDDHLLSDFRVSFGDVVTDEFVNSLRLRRSGGFASTDRPYRFVSDNHAFKRRSALSFQYRVDLTSTDFFSFAGFVFCFGFTDAQNRSQTLLFQHGEFLRDQLVRLFVVSTTLRVADDDVLRADILQHFSRSFTGECARQVQVNVLRAQNDVATGSGVFRHVDIHFRRCNRNCTASNASQFFTQVSHQLVYHVAAAVQFPVTHH